MKQYQQLLFFSDRCIIDSDTFTQTDGHTPAVIYDTGELYSGLHPKACTINVCSSTNKP